MSVLQFFCVILTGMVVVTYVRGDDVSIMPLTLKKAVLLFFNFFNIFSVPSSNSPAICGAAAPQSARSGG